MTMQILKNSLGFLVGINMFLVFSLLAPVRLLAADRVDSFDLELYGGYRTDKLDWNIAGDSSGTVTPNILSELVWDELDIYQFGTESSLRISNHLVPFFLLVTGSANYGTVVDGTNQDSDYRGDNRTLEFSRSNNDSSDGDVMDLSLAVGPEFVFYQKKLSLAPLFGYSYHEQNLKVKEGFQVIPASGAFSGLDSSYDSVWKGQWFGLNIKVSPNQAFSLSGRIEYHTVKYQADADWNLRSDLKHPVSFAHSADDADGIVVSLEADLPLTAKLLFTTKLSYMKWQAEDGIDTVFAANNSVSTTRLNEVNWESTGINLGLKFMFN